MKRDFLLLICILLVAINCSAQELSITQKITYKKVRLLSQAGNETPALVNRLTGKVEYVWNGNAWTNAPPIFQQYYDNRRSIKARIDKNNSMRLLKENIIKKNLEAR